MAEFVSARQAVACIRDGDMVGVNAFVTLANPRELTRALAQRYREEGAPRDLTVFCASSYGAWDGDEGTEEFVESGAVKSVVMGFYNSAPRTVELIEQNRLAAYNLPLGCLSHMIRAAAGGHDFYLSKIGLNLFVDPQTDGRPLNAVSKDRWVEHVEVFGEHFLKYRCPKFDVALIKASSADQYGNISFEDESVVADALTHTYDVHIRVANTGRKLLPGMVASVSFSTAGSNYVNLRQVPVTAVQKAADGSLFVWTVAADKTAHRAKVSVGSVSGNHIGITDGIDVGQRVVTEGYQKLSEGTRVTF